MVHRGARPSGSCPSWQIHQAPCRVCVPCSRCSQRCISIRHAADPPIHDESVEKIGDSHIHFAEATTQASFGRHCSATELCERVGSRKSPALICGICHLRMLRLHQTATKPSQSSARAARWGAFPCQRLLSQNARRGHQLPAPALHKTILSALTEKTKSSPSPTLSSQ
jgi:hypothetical protein